jgi:hypothetical protein
MINIVYDFCIVFVTTIVMGIIEIVAHLIVTWIKSFIDDCIKKSSKLSDYTKRRITRINYNVSCIIILINNTFIIYIYYLFLRNKLI